LPVRGGATISRGQVVEEDAIADAVGVVEVDRQDLDQREIILVVLGRADLARDRVARRQTETLDLGGRDVDVIGTREVVVVRVAQETVAVLEDLQHALGEDQPALLGLRLHDLEDQLLLAHGRRAADLERLGRRDQGLVVHAVERVEVDALALLFDLLGDGDRLGVGRRNGSPGAGAAVAASASS
jgi:hypothetical protein